MTCLFETLKKSDLSFDRSETRVNARDRTAALLSFLRDLCANTIKCGFDAVFLAGHKFESTLQCNIWGIHLKN